MSKDEALSTVRALKLALEALELANVNHWWGSSSIEQAITAIKEALMSHSDEAQPAVTESHKQEPVAWMDDYNACKCPDNEARCFSDKVFRMMQKHTDSLVKRQEPVAKVCHDLDGHIGWNPNLKQLLDEGTPLYTTPSQRKPLDMSEIVQLTYDIDEDKPATMTELFRFARAIEAAHGITARKAEDSARSKT